MRILAGCILAAAAWAQPAFQNLAPTGDGSAVYFSSSLRMKGTDQYPNQPKIFVWREKGGVQLYEQKPPTIYNAGGEGWGSTTAYNLVAPSVSSDGGTIAITGLSDCNYGEICAVDVNRYQAEIHVAGSSTLMMDGAPSVSPNGGFVALSSPILASFGSQQLTVLDLANGQQQHPTSSSRFPLRHGVANNGTVVLNSSNDSGSTIPPPFELQPWPGTAVPLNVSTNGPLLIEAAGVHVFYEAFDNPSPDSLVDLTVFDVATGAITELAAVETTSGAVESFDISDDGSLVAFVQLGQVWIVHGDGSGLMRIPNVQDPVVEVAMSGSGSHIFAITNNSRVLRINLSTLAVEEIIPATPAPNGLYFQSMTLTPGGYATAVTAMQPIPELQSISLFGHEFAILTASASALQLQVPYDIPQGVGWPNAVLKQQPGGPFESAMLASPVQILAFYPGWFFVDNHVAALHQDFSGPITAANPALPGEIIHAYGSGFGLVAPEPALGKPASASPLSRITTPLVCGLQGDNSSFVSGDILFAGLAPGWVGLYQFDIRLPAPPTGADAYLICGQAENPLAGNYASGFLPMAAK